MRRITRLTTLTVLALLASLFVAVPAAQSAPAVTDGVELELVAGGFAQPVDVTSPPDDPRIFVVEKSGVIRIIENGDVLAQPFLDIRSIVYIVGGEQGLLGLAFHPKYRTNGKFYVSYTSEVGSGDSTISEFSVTADPNIADATSERVLLRIDQPRTNHNGGQLAFANGLLFASIGDGGSGGAEGQNTSSLLGTILRLDVDGGRPYAVPGDNPFVGSAGRDEIWAYGLRNPWRFAIDAVGGNIYIADVGQNAREEVDVARIGAGGLNYGWDTMEGTRCYDPPGCDDPSFTPPVLEYTHDEGCSITGGVVYRGSELPQLVGHYFYGDLCGGFIRSFRFDQGRVLDETDWTNTLGRFDRPVAFGLDAFGEMYIASFGGGIYRLSSTRADGCDPNGDGFADMVVGAPGRDDGAENGGTGYVLFGSTGGPQPSGSSMLPGAGAGSALGEAVACGDVNGDGYDDVVLGAPGDGSVPGEVAIVEGSSDGPRFGAYVWPRREAWRNPSDAFGAALAVGDFNRDGFADVAVGAPGSNLAGLPAAGRVYVYYGSETGIRQNSSKPVSLHQNSPGVPDQIEAGDRFGAALAAADFDGDGFDDLAVGVPGQQVDRFKRAGIVQMFSGSATGLAPGDTWDRLDPAIAGKVRRNANFGAALVAGNFDGDPYDDLAVGVPGMSNGAGEVTVLYGSRRGVSDRDFRLRQGLRQVTGKARVGDGFGAALAAGDINGDGWDDLAVGVPGEDVLGVIDAGAVDIVFGERRGLVGGKFRRRFVAQQSVPGAPLVGDHFGAALRIADFDGNGAVDLVVGAPSGGDADGPGRVIGITAPRGAWSLETPGIEGDPMPDDRFGAAL